MMISEKEKLIRAKEVLVKIANGINPVDGKAIEDEGFLTDPRIIRCLFYVADVLTLASEGRADEILPKPTEFIITPEEKSKVRFPEHKIGVSQFAKCINQTIDLSRSKKLTGVGLNKQLKILGLLSEKIDEDGRKRTVTNDQSGAYGFELEQRSFNGTEYEMVVFNERGRQYLLDNIESIMSAEETTPL